MIGISQRIVGKVEATGQYYAPKPTNSLWDILPSPAANVQSPKAPIYSGYEISIRNPLVKHVAWAYLQPMSTSPSADGSHRPSNSSSSSSEEDTAGSEGVLIVFFIFI
ncbi:hypothetical protein L2E82_25075 [Cichorium intybus]|uniref:Uncharacterized protein n=1 Tax=Cichorium intybus TaxID=13427 RepID=A0ACB9E2N4_CICIN|nr:hypothetical protein L2E82_25075 [Cichorium intybus]